jgi:hypothetical protein
MAAKKRVAKAGAKAGRTALQARYNPYLQRLVEDEDLRKNLADAFESAKSAYGRLSNGKNPTSQIFDDKKLQKDIRQAAFGFRDATVTLRDAPKRKRRGRLGRLLLLALVGGGAALALSEDLRKKVLDALFGAEEEFEYTSSTTPSTPPTTAPAAGTAT